MICSTKEATDSLNFFKKELVDIFLIDGCIFEDFFYVNATVLYKHFLLWLKENGYGSIFFTTRSFGDIMNLCGIKKRKSRYVFYVGLTIRKNIINTEIKKEEKHFMEYDINNSTYMNELYEIISFIKKNQHKIENCEMSGNMATSALKKETGLNISENKYNGYLKNLGIIIKNKREQARDFIEKNSEKIKKLKGEQIVKLIKKETGLNVSASLVYELKRENSFQNLLPSKDEMKTLDEIISIARAVGILFVELGIEVPSYLKRIMETIPKN